MLSFSLQGDRIYLPAAVSALRSLVTGETLRCVLVLILLIEFVITRLWPAFSLVGSSGGYTSHGYTSHASPRACGARLGQIVKSGKVQEKVLSGNFDMHSATQYEHTII